MKCLSLEEPKSVATSELIIRMPVSLAKSMVGIKEYGEQLETEELQKRTLLTAIILEYLFAKSGIFYKKLDGLSLIDSSFIYQRTCDTTYGYSVIGGNTSKPEEFAATVKQMFLSVKDITIPTESIERMKKCMIGSRLRRLDSIEIIGQEYPWYENRGLNYFNQGKEVEAITTGDVHDFLKNWIQEKNIAVCSIIPEEEV